MATRKPLIVNPGASQIQELPAGDSVDGIATLTATTLVGNGVVPVGGIIMWSGTIASLATSAPNFKLCDGNNGTPDLTNRFVIGANADDGGVAKTNIETGTYSGTNIPKQSGGFKNAILISHTHTQTSSGTNDDGGSHSPQGSPASGTLSNISTTGVNVNNAASTTQTGCDANLPPYFALAYIMRVS